MLHDLSALPDPDTAPQFYDGVAIKRLLAWVADALGILVVTLLVWLPITVLTLGFGAVLFGAIWLVVALLWRVWSIAQTSATPGMRLMAIELRNRMARASTPPRRCFTRYSTCCSSALASR
jgi:uncharacterized RDD family membrane protein YckC